MPMEPVTVPPDWRGARTLFPSRNQRQTSIRGRNDYSVALPGWDATSRWTTVDLRTEGATLVRDGVQALTVSAGPAGAGTPGTLALALVTRLDLEPEVVVAGMGMSFPHPVLRPATQIDQALVAHRRDDDHGRGERATLAWLAGQEERRPGSGWSWSGGRPAPWAADAERLIADGRRDVGESPEWFTGVGKSLLWAMPNSGSGVPLQWDGVAWLWRRLLGRPITPYDPTGPDCTVLRGRAFRSWEVVNRDGRLGVVVPGRERGEWVATADGERLSDQVHHAIADAAYEVMLDGFGTGRVPSDPTGWGDRRPLSTSDRKGGRSHEH